MIQRGLNENIYLEVQNGQIYFLNLNKCIYLALFRVCLVVRRQNGELESERVKMENRGYDKKVKFVRPRKV